MTTHTRENVDTPQGLAFAITAYLLWGFLPLYMKAVSHIPAAEVVAHRVIWSVPLAGALLIVLRRTGDLRAALRSPRTLLMACITAVLISVNWGIYVWSIATDHALDAALGYYINPLFSVALGALLLGERPSRTQMLAIALAAAAVVVLTVETGSLPWAAVGLTFSWGFYAFFKKWLPVGPNQGFLLEVLILSVPALAYLSYLTATGTGSFGISWGQSLLLMGCGVVTAVPLIIYANGAKLLRLSTIGILQYIAPTLIFLVAVFVFGEEFGHARMIAFPMIWAALVIYSIPLIRQMRRKPKVQKVT
ncbi:MULTISPECIES: EamA family transporter RarD [Rhodobacterales]|jgi:chloramphenicol-sensitive protein RarD|uniref:EamA family transporter RarD n=1 Tax=Rhodobacterales TaxID=204455 RepID=UPI00237F3874|nr:EamA family transporter RarD [Phaeobacter gallaeciensis]MDE4097904.1 EamA family transporter RarD [Phaeobacter gallaeciensis]MDE4106837.1 EamA family transporter RarD [Phaeobacter gallaeciensis]MDE4111291.1 EamA family transporter RarD [Phaeobacter gallaeciensis]MDE4115639.1 EamA family transporter RarD [Phaeobacter gallaeciensis]MDE4120232.1 EamA family transporter RarD [Phaeobacter gallaeciensis]